MFSTLILLIALAQQPSAKPDLAHPSARAVAERSHTLQARHSRRVRRRQAEDSQVRAAAYQAAPTGVKSVVIEAPVHIERPWHSPYYGGPWGWYDCYGWWPAWQIGVPQAYPWQFQVGMGSASWSMATGWVIP